MAGDREITAPLDAAALRAGWAAKGEGRPRRHAWLAVGARTDMGRVRENNEDKYDFLEPDEPAVLASKGRFYAVADGMGGHQAGQIASELALKTVFRAYYSDAAAGGSERPDVGASITRAVAEANRYLLDVARMIPERSGMGTTLTGAIALEDELFVVQVGDSRCYLLRGGRMEQVTEDHSWVQEQVSRGVMSLEDAEMSPFRNVITRSLGAAPEVEPDVFAIRMEVGDRLVLCTDGLNGMMGDGELFELAREGSPSVAAWNLVDRAVENGGKDNVTVLVLDVLAIEPWEEAEERSRRARASRGVEAEEQERTASVESGGPRSTWPASGGAESEAVSGASVSEAADAAPRRGVRSIMKGLLGK